jgi:hypothetical protein
VAESKTIGMPTRTKRIKSIVDSRSPMLDTIDKLTEPTACSLWMATDQSVCSFGWWLVVDADLF